jgi:hypothetical protein
MSSSDGATVTASSDEAIAMGSGDPGLGRQPYRHSGGPARGIKIGPANYVYGNGEQATRVPGFVKRARARCSAIRGACGLPDRNREPRTLLHAVRKSREQRHGRVFRETFKRDYVRVNPFPAARTALLRIDHWMEDYNSEHPHPVWVTAHRGSTLHQSDQPSVRSNGVNSSER